MQLPPLGCKSSRLRLVVMEEGIGHQVVLQVINVMPIVTTFCSILFEFRIDLTMDAQLHTVPDW